MLKATQTRHNEEERLCFVAIRMSMQRGDQLYVDLNAPCKKQNRGDEGVVNKSKEINRVKKEKYRRIKGSCFQCRNVRQLWLSQDCPPINRHSAFQPARTPHKYMRMSLLPFLQHDATHRQSLSDIFIVGSSPDCPYQGYPWGILQT